MENKNKSINEKELEILNFWKENKIFKKSLEKPGGENPIGEFSFFDGPPFATGLPHHGHLLAGSIKDSTTRYQTMNGKYVRRVWGWDCHGLPIENMIEKEFNLNSKKDIEEFGIDKFNKAAEASVFKYEKEWKEIVPRFGRWIDMDNPYKTMDYTYTESVWWAFKELDKKGLVFEGNKSMHICPRCETTLAQSEVAQNYKDLTDISVTAKFELESEPNTFVLAWTTTPWTLPGNVALAINGNFEYVKIIVPLTPEGGTNAENFTPPSGDGGTVYILAKDRLEYVMKDKAFEIIEEFAGEKLIGKKYRPLFDYYIDSNLENKENIYTIVSADFVTLDTGTGVVHIAPAFGEDDLNLGKEKSLPIIKHVGMNGEFTKDVKDFIGMKVKSENDNQSADIAILKNLSEKKLIFSKEKLIHPYPTCWRCYTPLLNYATSSWFINIPNIREKLINENKKINWIPENIRDGRFGKWLEGARDWAVSRSRYWGAPLPIWKEEGGDEIKIIGSLKELAENNFYKSKNEYYLMRHGEANHNVNCIEECQMDTENTLTELGIAEVEDAKKKCDIDFDIIISSPFLRTRHTAEIMAGDKKDKIVLNENFREINVGTFNKKPTKEVRDFYGDDYLKFKTNIGDGESHGDVMHRMMKGIYDLEKKYEGKKILIVTHGAPMRMATAGALLMTEEEVIKDELSNDTRLYPKNAEIRKIDLNIVSRDETGEVNLHRPYIDEIILKSKNGNKMKRVEYVFDCWFESGAMPYGQFHYPFENKELFQKNFPANFIAEGLDQTRGWFYSLLNLGVGIFGESPFKNVIVNGMLLASDGEKMSKSKKNYTDPMTLVEKYGADAFRQTLLSSPAMCAENIAFLDSGVEDTYKKVISKLENVLSFYEMTDLDFDLNENIENIISPIDNWILIRLSEIIKNTTYNIENYRLDNAARQFEKFVDDLSTWWLRRSRERLKGTNGEKDKKLSQFTLVKVLNEFSKVIAPFMPFISERIYQSVNKNTSNNQSSLNAAAWQRKESVHLESWPKEIVNIDEKILKEMEEVREMVTSLLMIRQKNNIPVRQPLAKAFINKNINEKYFEILKEEINVKDINIVDAGEENNLDLNLTEELKREGEQRELSRKIKDKRKELNFVSSDNIKLFISENKKDLIDNEYKKEMKISEVIFEKADDILNIERV